MGPGWPALPPNWQIAVGIDAQCIQQLLEKSIEFGLARLRALLLLYWFISRFPYKVILRISEMAFGKIRRWITCKSGDGTICDFWRWAINFAFVFRKAISTFRRGVLRKTPLEAEDLACGHAPMRVWRLCCTNDLTDGVPLSPDRFTPRPLLPGCQGR
jgi:hypothetical protein